MKDQLWLTAEPVGKITRYVVVSHKNDGNKNYWDGTEFILRFRCALKYETQEQAETAIHKILTDHYDKKYGTTFICPVFINVFSDDKNPSQAALLEYLDKCFKFWRDTPTHGSGPGNDLVLARIEWGRMKQFKKVKRK